MARADRTFVTAIGVSLAVVFGVAAAQAALPGGTASVSAVPATTSISLQAAGALPPLPQATAKDGLIATVQSTDQAFTSGEPFAFTITYRNVSTKAFRLPDRPDGPGLWLLHFEDLTTHLMYTGGSALPEGPPIPGQPSAAIQPGADLTTKVVFEDYGFVEETLDFISFEHAKLLLAMAAQGAMQVHPNDYMPTLHAGVYSVRVDIRFPRKENAGADPTPLWKHDDIVTNAIEVRVK